MLLAEELNILKQEFLNKKELKKRNNSFLKYKFDKKVDKLYNLCVFRAKKRAKEGLSKEILRVSSLKWFSCWCDVNADMYIGSADLSADVIKTVKERLEEQNIKVTLCNDECYILTLYKILLEW